MSMITELSPLDAVPGIGCHTAQRKKAKQVLGSNGNQIVDIAKLDRQKQEALPPLPVKELAKTHHQ